MTYSARRTSKFFKAQVITDTWRFVLCTGRMLAKIVRFSLYVSTAAVATGVVTMTVHVGLSIVGPV